MEPSTQNIVHLIDSEAHMYAIYFVSLLIISLSPVVFIILHNLKTNKKIMDQNVAIEGYVARIAADAAKISATLKTVQDELTAAATNPLSDQTMADLDAAVANLDALASAAPPAPPTSAAPENPTTQA